MVEPTNTVGMLQDLMEPCVKHTEFYMLKGRKVNAWVHKIHQQFVKTLKCMLWAIQAALIIYNKVLLFFWSYFTHKYKMITVKTSLLTFVNIKKFDFAGQTFRCFVFLDSYPSLICAVLKYKTPCNSKKNKIAWTDVMSSRTSLKVPEFTQDPRCCSNVI